VSALGMASLGVLCNDRALGMASLGVFCPSGEEPNRTYDRFRDRYKAQLAQEDEEMLALITMFMRTIR